MSEHRGLSSMRFIVDKVIKEKDDIQYPCDDDNEVYAKVMQLNRWRRSVLDERPELERVSFLRRFNPPRVVIAYDHSYETELLDSQGNPLGITLADLEQEHWQEVRAREGVDEAPVSDAQKRAELKALADQQGLSLSDLMDEENINYSEAQQTALAEAAKQKGRELTEGEKEAILHSTQDDSIDLDF